MQVRVASSGIKMGELRGDESPGFDLLDSFDTDAGVDGVVLCPGQCLGHGFVVQCRHSRGRLFVCQCPQNADTFHRREGEVEPGDCLLYLVAFAVDPGNDVFAGGVFVAELLGVERATYLLGQLRPLLHSGSPFLG